MAASILIDLKSIVTIGSRSARKVLGTGFSCIRGDWVLTAKHVVTVENNARDDVFVSTLGGGPHDAIVAGLHPRIDIAILHCPTLNCRRPLLPSHHSFTKNEFAFYAGLRPSLTSGEGVTVEVNQCSNVTAISRERDEIEECIEFDAPVVDGGHSGGPVLAQGGGVIGLIIDRFEREGNIRCRATSILPLLAELEIPSLWRTR